MQATQRLTTASSEADIDRQIEQRKSRGAFGLFIFSMAVPYFVIINVRYLMVDTYVPSRLDQVTGGIETALMLLSALAAIGATRAARGLNARAYRASVAAALAGGLVATLMMLYEMWYHPMNPMSHFGETFLVSIGLAIVINLASLLTLLAGRARSGRKGITGETLTSFELPAWFWVFATAGWIALYIELYFL